MTRRPLQRLLALALGLSTLGVSTALIASGLSREKLLRFAADMAEQGNWREAEYRWKQITAEGGEDANVVNNLAVAAEATGRVDEAVDLYDRALALSSGDARIAGNAARARRVQQELREAGPDGDQVAPDAVDSVPLPTPAPTTERPSKGGKPLEVRIGIPIAPPIDLSNMHSVLVASFLADESSMLDVNRELVRLLRGEFRKRTALQVIDAVPPPAIPEQRPNDLALNAEFWKHLGREYDADLIVSGAVQYSRRDASGFRDVDIVDPLSGQKVRQTRFVEEEEFTYAVDVMFFDGATGMLLHRNHVRRGVSFRGLMNDPIHAFYEIGEAIGDEVLSSVVSRIRSETRTIFRK